MSNETPTPRTDAICEELKCGGFPPMIAKLREFEREITEVTKQRDALADALQYALAYPMTDNWYGKAMEALATLKPCD